MTVPKASWIDTASPLLGGTTETQGFQFDETIPVDGSGTTARAQWQEFQKSEGFTNPPPLGPVSGRGLDGPSERRDEQRERDRIRQDWIQEHGADAYRAYVASNNEHARVAGESRSKRMGRIKTAIQATGLVMGGLAAASAFSAGAGGAFAGEGGAAAGGGAAEGAATTTATEAATVTTETALTEGGLTTAEQLAAGTAGATGPNLMGDVQPVDLMSDTPFGDISDTTGINQPVDGFNPPHVLTGDFGSPNPDYNPGIDNLDPPSFPPPDVASGTYGGQPSGPDISVGGPGDGPSVDDLMDDDDDGGSGDYEIPPWLQAIIEGVGADQASGMTQEAMDFMERGRTESLDFLRESRDLSFEKAEPFRQAGVSSVSAMMDMTGQDRTGIEGIEGRPQYDWKTDPGYEWRKSEGIRAREQSKGAKGGLYSGGTAKEIERYGQEYASAEYSKVYDRLGVIAGFGPAGAAAGVDAAMGAGVASANVNQNYGSGIASGYIHQGNIMGSALDQIAGLDWGKLFG